jgi:hypothetical protein
MARIWGYEEEGRQPPNAESYLFGKMGLYFMPNIHVHYKLAALVDEP